ncbi:MAG: Deoxyribodipyrimidine photo-lyase [Deferribacteraceae bacterium]|jgi:deoxyribodipyrimidine photo-lyase|nr:Deoxyribodipyrimidine photo-lyase [Deferribacteraceae bacterium]
MNILEGRIKQTHKAENKGKYILYWMQGAFRCNYNHSLEFSIYLSNLYNLPLIVLVILNLDYPEANYRSFKFFLEGLNDISNTLKNRKISLHLRKGRFESVLSEYKTNIHTLVTDKSYLPNLKNIKIDIFKKLNLNSYEVDTNLVVPVEIASSKMEYGGYTIRPKIKRLYENYISDFSMNDYKNAYVEQIIDFDINDTDSLLKSVEYVSPINIKGGEKNAENTLEYFIQTGFKRYALQRNDPCSNVESNLSPFLHFGHISPIKVLKTLPHDDFENYEAFLEQIVIRRELAHNFTFYSDTTNNLSKYLPKWAKDTLFDHKQDEKKYLYKLKDFEQANTHDIYWNAAQKELLKTGKIHNYMRMYWGKKIIEWSNDYKEAYNIMAYLNNKYAIDGRDPNSYAGIMWCFGMHDRPFIERDIFGKIRYMSENGLKRKFDIEKYYKMWSIK